MYNIDKAKKGVDSMCEVMEELKLEGKKRLPMKCLRTKNLSKKSLNIPK
jgi:hypothetical protein